MSHENLVRSLWLRLLKAEGRHDTMRNLWLYSLAVVPTELGFGLKISLY
jgi:hypothetical protein